MALDLLNRKIEQALLRPHTIVAPETHLNLWDRPALLLAQSAPG
jgi:hypothetical protein